MPVHALDVDVVGVVAVEMFMLAALLTPCGLWRTAPQSTALRLCVGFGCDAHDLSLGVGEGCVFQGQAARGSLIAVTQCDVDK